MNNTNNIDNLIKWAIENNIPEPSFDYLEELGLNSLSHFISYGGGFPRNQYDLENSMYVLKLNNCNVSYLHDDICKLSKLKQIDLRDNKLTKLPNKISNLENLEILNIADNNLLLLPSDIVNLKKLRIFIFNGNENLKLTPSQENWITKFKSNDKYG